MKVIIDGTPEEVRAFFQSGDLAALAITPEIDMERLTVELRWLTKGASKGLRYICENAPRVGFDEVAEHVGVDTKKLSGMMSSVGHSAPSVGKLFGRDYSRREYVIEPEAAKVLLRAFELNEAQ